MPVSRTLTVTIMELSPLMLTGVTPVAGVNNGVYRGGGACQHNRVRSAQEDQVTSDAPK
jgi:hypothetical protein